MSDAPLARSVPADEHLRWLVEQVQTKVLETKDKPVSLVLTGSLARGEGTVLFRGTRPLVLSDFDIAVIYKDLESREAGADGLAAASRTLSRKFQRWGLMAAIDLGGYALSDLERQSARPGTLEFRRSGRVIWGDESVLDRIPAYRPENISGDEVLMLCENRLLELLWTHDAIERGGNSPYAPIYAGGKALLDGALAWLVAHDRFPRGVEERLRAIEEDPPFTSQSANAMFLDALRFWSHFKLRPSEQAIRHRFGVLGDAGTAAGKAWREGAIWLLGVYRRLVETGSAQVTGHGSAWIAASQRAPLRRRVRRWAEAWRDRNELGLPWAGIGSLLSLAPRGTPEHLLGASAAALVACAPEMHGEGSEREAAARLADSISPVPFPSDATWEVRRDRLVQAWDRWVLRGTRTGEGDRPWAVH